MGWLDEVDAATGPAEGGAGGEPLRAGAWRGGRLRKLDSGRTDRVRRRRGRARVRRGDEMLGGLAPAGAMPRRSGDSGSSTRAPRPPAKYAVGGGVLEGGADRDRRSAAKPATKPELLSTMQAALGAQLGFPPATETWMFHRLEALEANGTPRVPAPRRFPRSRSAAAAGAHRHRREAGSDQPGVRRDRRGAANARSAQRIRASNRPRRRRRRRSAVADAACSGV